MRKILTFIYLFLVNIFNLSRTIVCFVQNFRLNSPFKTSFDFNLRIDKGKLRILLIVNLYFPYKNIFLYTESFVASLQCAATGPDPSFSIRGKQDGDDGSGSLGEYALALGGIDVVVKQPVP